MLNNRYIIFLLFLLSATFTTMAQKAERDYIRKGNRAYKDSTYVDAEVSYRKALEANPQSSISMYNLGNALLHQQKAQEAMEQYQKAANVEKDKGKLAQIYHNAGVLFHASKDYAKAIEAYKMSLRNNPKDDETRYNLALAQKMLQDQQDQQQDQNQDQQEQQDKEDQKDQKDQEQPQDQQQQDQQNQDQQQQQPEQQENEMSKENAEQMLNAVMQDEKDVQEKVKKEMQVIQSRPLENDW